MFCVLLRQAVSECISTSCRRCSGRWVAPPGKIRGLPRELPVKVCGRCGGTFRGRSNRQKFCDSCQREARNDYQKEFMRKRRKNTGDVSV